MLIMIFIAVFVLGVVLGHYVIPAKHNGEITMTKNKSGVNVAAMDFGDNAQEILNTKSSITFKIIRK